MLHEINLSGILVAPFAAFLFWAAFVFIPVRIWFDRIQVQKWVWHRRLFEFAIFLIILALIGLQF
jgi:hypothetical protein